MHALVIGGGVAGLAASLALARAGNAVTLLEGDGTPLPATPDEAFATWKRPGAPQLWHSHAFLARLHALLRERAPDVLSELLARGAREIPFLDHLPPEMDDRTPEPGDDRLVLLACRRVTFEWVLRRLVAREPGVRWRGGVRVEGLVAEPGATLRVTGARVRGEGGAEEILSGDVVVDASGRRSRLPAWLAELGAPALPEDDEDSGIVYCSRFYRLRAGAEAPEGQGVVGADLGYMKYGIFPGDGDYFSVTLAVPTDDAELRRLLRPAPFEAGAAALPATAPWVDPERAEAVSDVRGMAKLRNRVRRLVEDGRPLALGLHAIGDAAVCTNPLYGRGCSLAFVHAFLLADALAEHPRDPAAAALALDAATRREIEPWYRAARDQDRDGLAVAAALRRGEDPYGSERSDGTVDPRAYMRALLRDGFLPLLRTDIVALRAFVRTFNLLDPPEALMGNPALLPRVVASYQARAERAPVEDGPPRDELLRLLARAA